MYCDLSRPIGQLGSVDGWKQLPIKECGEPLVALGAFSDYRQIATSSIYVGERQDSPYPCVELKGSLFTVFVREGVAKKLTVASALLPKDHMLLVWDAYRPLAVQKALFDYFVEVLEKRGTSHEQAIVDAQKFVSIPSDDPTRPPPHNTGGAVDLTIIRINNDVREKMELYSRIVARRETPHNWRQIYAAEMHRIKIIREESTILEMGTAFDGVHPQTATRHYEDLDLYPPNKVEDECRNNRRRLWNVMTAVGFSNYPEEWWHYDFGNQFHTARTDEKAIYGAATLSEENVAHEKIRRGHYLGSVAISEGKSPQCKLGHPYYPFVHQVTRETGNIQHTSHPQAASI